MTRREAQLEDQLRQCGELLRKERANGEKLTKRLVTRPQPETRIETREVVKTPKPVLQQLEQQQREIAKLRADLASQRERTAFLLREFEARRPLSELWTTLTYQERKMAIRNKLRPRRAKA